MHKITPFLWYDDQAEAAMNFYVSVRVELELDRLRREAEITAEQRTQAAPGHRAVDSMPRLEKTIRADPFLRVQQGAKLREPSRRNVQ